MTNLVLKQVFQVDSHIISAMGKGSLVLAAVK